MNNYILSNMNFLPHTYFFCEHTSIKIYYYPNLQVLLIVESVEKESAQKLRKLKGWNIFNL